jgi:hypothetical protein
MNKKYALPAIAMVAVIMGMSAFAPAAMADRSYAGEVKAVCHLDHDISGNGIKDEDAADVAWVVLTPNNHGASHGHANHGDVMVNDSTEAGFCVSLQTGAVAP